MYLIILFLDSHLKALREVPTEESNVPKVPDLQLFSVIENERGCRNLLPKHIFSQDALLPYSHHLQLLQRDPISKIKIYKKIIAFHQIINKILLQGLDYQWKVQYRLH